MKKTFKDYGLGFVHIDIKYLLQMPDETSRRYLFVAIDHATRWVLIEIIKIKMISATSIFYQRCVRLARSKSSNYLLITAASSSNALIQKIRKKERSSMHAFDGLCKQLGNEHRLISSHHPQTNDMLDPLNGRSIYIVRRTRFAPAAEMN